MTDEREAIEEATDAAFLAIEGIARDIEADFPRPTGRAAFRMRQARRLREAVETIQAELNAKPPTVTLVPMTVAPDWVSVSTPSGVDNVFENARYRK